MLVQVAKLAMLSLTAVFRDILPGYRIRLPTDKELAMPVSKDVKRVRDHESALLSQYQAFLKGLLRGAQGHRGMPVARAAVKCMATLLQSRFTFNFASDLLQASQGRSCHSTLSLPSLLRCIVVFKFFIKRHWVAI